MNRNNLQLTAQVIASDTQPLFDIAKSKGIQMPHPALGIFKSVLAEIEKPNANGYRLSEKATKEAVATLPGCQINRDHSVRRDPKTLEFVVDPIILGHVIDSEINKDNLIEVICIFYKYQYFEEWEEAQELFEKNKLKMSFELSYDIESAEKLADKTTRITDFYFTGAGLLFGITPACKKANVLEITAQKLQERLSIERQSLIFANNQKTQKSIMEVLKLMADEVKKIEEVNVADAVVEIPKVEEVAKVEETVVTPKTEESNTADAPKVEEAQKICPECKEPMKDDECAVCKNKKASEEAKAEISTKVVPVVVVTELTQKVTDTMLENSETIKVETTEVRTVNDQEKQKTVTVQETTFTYAQVEEIKAKYETEVASLKEQLVVKDKEVESIKADLEAMKVVKLEAAKKEENIPLSTGHKPVDASEESGSPIARLLKNKKANRK